MGSVTATLRVLIAEDAYIAREGTRRLLQSQDGIDVVGAASDYETALADRNGWSRTSS